MKKDLLKKMQLGLISLSTLALLAACGNDNMDDPDLDDDPAIEEPVDEETNDDAEVDETTDEDAD